MKFLIATIEQQLLKKVLGRENIVGDTLLLLGQAKISDMASMLYAICPLHQSAHSHHPPPLTTQPFSQGCTRDLFMSISVVAQISSSTGVGDPSPHSFHLIKMWLRFSLNIYSSETPSWFPLSNLGISGTYHTTLVFSASSSVAPNGFTISCLISLFFSDDEIINTYLIPVTTS